MRQRHCWHGVCVFATVLVAMPALAAPPPAVHFSVSPTVVCRDVTPPEFAARNSLEKLIEAEFRVSVLIWQGSEHQIEELLFVLSSPQRRLRIVDFWPRTESITDIVGPIERSESHDSTRSLEAALRGSVSAGQAGVNGQLTPSLSAGQTRHEGVKETYKKLPPKQLLLASGTLEGDSSVFFKLKPSTQASLEGARLFSCVFAVPVDWRGDWLQLTSLAKGRHNRQLVTRIEECGRDESYVGLHLEGDMEARLLAEQLADAQAREKPSASDVSPELDLRGRSLATLDEEPAFVRLYRRMLNLPPREPATARHTTLKPAPTLAESLAALQSLSGRQAQLEKPGP